MDATLDRLEELPTWERIKKVRRPAEPDPKFHCGKKVYESRAAAKWAVRLMRSSGSKVSAYQCLLCRRIHVGNHGV